MRLTSLYLYLLRDSKPPFVVWDFGLFTHRRRLSIGHAWDSEPPSTGGPNSLTHHRANLKGLTSNPDHMNDEQ